MKFIKKVVPAIAILIVLTLIYHYTKPKYYVKTAEAKNLPCKVRPFRDSAYLYIPYKFTIYNNRISNLKISGINDGGIDAYSREKYLLYNGHNLELESFWNPSTELKKKNNRKAYGDKAYWRIQYVLKYREHIFPFLKRDFYYFKRYTVSNKNDRLKIKQISRDSIRKQLYALNYNVPIAIGQSTIDSLYQINNNKRFNVRFSSRALVIKMIRARINNEKQEMVYANFYDSVKGMERKEMRDYMLKRLKRQPEDSF